MRNHRARAILVVCSVSLWPIAVAAQGAVCTQTYEKAQEEKLAGHLNAALVHLKSCIDPSCPKFIREDCARWMDETESALPSVVFAVRRDGNDLTDVDVVCDGRPLTRSLDGKAIPLDPGLHNFTFSIPDFVPVERNVLIRAGERNRMVEVEFQRAGVAVAGTALATGGGAGSVGTKPIKKYVPYALTGLGVLGLAGFTTFAILGNNQKSDLERSCSPYCSASQVDSVRTKYLLADAFLGVGIVSLGVATYLFIKGHGQTDADAGQKTSVAFSPRPSGAGGVVQVASSF